MALPEVSMSFQNGNLGLTTPAEDGVFVLVCGYEFNAVNHPEFAAQTIHYVTSMTEVAALGITDSVDNHPVYQFLSDFFAESGEGNKIYLFPFDRSNLLSDMYTADVVTGKVPVKKVLDATNGDISGIFNVWNPDSSVTLTLEDALDEDVWATLTAAQDFLESYTDSEKSPVWAVIEGFNFSGDVTALRDLNQESFNRCQVVIGATETRTGTTAFKGASLGRYAGRLSVNKVSVNPGRKKDGALYSDQCYIVDTPVELFDVAGLHDKNYVTFRTHKKTSGYFISDCPMATASTDDYSKLTRRRVIDKAYRLGYAVVNEEILNDFNLTSDGTIDPIYAKKIESDMIASVYTNMTLESELSADATDPTDKGCICSIDTTYATGTTGKIKFNYFQVRTRGYAEMIEVPIGFISTSNS